MHPIKYLRLKNNPPPEVPPSGNVDLFHDAASRTIRVRDSSGAETVIGGGPGGGEVTLGGAQTITGVKTFEATTSFAAPSIFEDGVEFESNATFTFHPDAKDGLRAALQIDPVADLTTDDDTTPLAASQGAALDEDKLSRGSVTYDLCAAPYKIAPGSDITATVQAIIDAADVANQDVTIYFSNPGTYLINGPMQSGTLNSVNYEGQILLPARSADDGAITIRIKGPTPPSGTPAASTDIGVILQTNATSGHVIDALNPADGYAYVGSDVRLIVEDIVLRAPDNPGVSWINGEAFRSLCFRGSVRIDVAAFPPTAATGTRPAVKMPGFNNWFPCMQSGSLVILGYPVGIRVGEHFTCEYVTINSCKVGMQFSSTGADLAHVVPLGHVCIQGTETCFQWYGSTTASLPIHGVLDIGDNGAGVFNLATVIDDPTNNLHGTLHINAYDAVRPKGFLVKGAQNLRLTGTLQRLSDYPHDTFQRLHDVFATSGLNLGATDYTYHVWSIASGGTFAHTAGSVATATSSPLMLMRYPLPSGPRSSRRIRLSFSAGSTRGLYLRMGHVIGGAKAGNWMHIRCGNGSGNDLVLMKNIGGVGTTLQTASSKIFNGQSYVLDVEILNTSLGGRQVVAELDGVRVLSYRLTSTDLADLADTEPELVADGFQFAGDVGSAVTAFRVMPHRLHPAPDIYTVAELPSAAMVGDTAIVTDANGPSFGVAVSGGGAVTTPVFYSGAAWVVG